MLGSNSECTKNARDFGWLYAGGHPGVGEDTLLVVQACQPPFVLLDNCFEKHSSICIELIFRQVFARKTCTFLIKIITS